MLPVLEVLSREDLGKRPCGRTRRTGYIPGVVYTEGQNLFVNISNEKLSDILKNFGENSLLELKIGPRTTTALIKEIQRHPISKEFLHVDFKPVDIEKTIKAKVPIVFTNTEEMNKQGGIVQNSKNEVEVECMAKDIPRSVNIDVSKFKVGESIKLKDVEMSQEISILGSPEEVVASFVLGNR